MKFRVWAACLLLVICPPVVAAEDEVAKVREGISSLLGGVEPDYIEASPVSGLYEVAIGPRIIYVSADGRYVVQGKIFDIKTRKDLTEAKLANVKREAIAELGEENMVVFSPEKYDHTITVFTDIDCGYCRKMHSEMDGYHEKGIRVRYLFYPRAGAGSDSYNKAVSVWCAEDRNKAMTDAKQGKALDLKECENPVGREMLLGQLLGVTGTPSIFLEDGEMLPGYVTPERLAKYLQGKK